jgi:hypothetical protein
MTTNCWAGVGHFVNRLIVVDTADKGTMSTDSYVLAEPLLISRQRLRCARSKEHGASILHVEILLKGEVSIGDS